MTKLPIGTLVQFRDGFFEDKSSEDKWNYGIITDYYIRTGHKNNVHYVIYWAGLGEFNIEYCEWVEEAT